MPVVLRLFLPSPLHLMGLRQDLTGSQSVLCFQGAEPGLLSVRQASLPCGRVSASQGGRSRIFDMHSWDQQKSVGDPVPFPRDLSAWEAWLVRRLAWILKATSKAFWLLGVGGPTTLTFRIDFLRPSIDRLQLGVGVAVPVLGKKLWFAESSKTSP